MGSLNGRYLHADEQAEGGEEMSVWKFGLEADSESQENRA
jgi:hypothetical protein